MDTTTQAIYIHPAPVRVWHWINATCFIILIITGFKIRFAELFTFVPLEDAIILHNYVAFITIANYMLWLFYYFRTGKIRIYFPDFRFFAKPAIKQIIFYASGIFKGAPNPHVITPENKFNPLQQQAYLAIMFLLLPVQMITGLFLWKVKSFENYISLLGGVKVIDTIHVFLSFFFVAFLVAHCYLATLGHTPTAHIKAMFTGYEEAEESTH